MKNKIKAKSSKKGKTYENKIAKIIHNALMQSSQKYKSLFNESKEQFKVKRNPDSFQGMGGTGDIDIPMPNIFPWSIEAKHHKEFNYKFDTFHRTKLKALIRIYYDHEKKLIKLKLLNDLAPIIIWRANLTLDYVFTESKFFDLKFSDNYTIRLIDNVSFITMTLDEFLEIGGYLNVVE